MRSEVEIKVRLERIQEQINLLKNKDGSMTIASEDDDRDEVVMGLYNARWELRWMLGMDIEHPSLDITNMVNPDGSIRRVTLVDDDEDDADR